MFNVGSAVAYLKLNTQGWTTGMGKANSSLKTLSRTMFRLGAVTTTSLTLITREFGKFDKAIRHATSVSETTEAQFKQMSDMALDASVKWNKAARNTAQAFYFLGSAGLSVTEQMQAFNTTIMLSRAMGSDLAKTVEGTVDIVRAFGLEFANIDSIADQLTKTVISSNQTFDVLTKAMSYAASTAKMTNNTLAETSAMLGIMANAGIKGSMAGTVLRRAMANLMAPMGAMRGLIYELGLEIYDATGKMKPFVEIMGDISDRLEGTTDEYKNLIFRTLFGVRALAGQIRLFDMGSEAIKKYADEIKNAGGVTERVAGKQMKALTEQAGRLWRQLQKIAIITGQALAPAMKRVVDRLLEQAKAMEGYIKNNAEAIATTLKWIAIIGALAVAVPIMISLISGVLSLVNPFTVVIGMLYLLRTVWEDTFRHGGVMNKSLDEFGKVLTKWADEKFGILDEILKTMWTIGMAVPKGYQAIWDVSGKIADLIVPVPADPKATVTFEDIAEKAKAAAAELGGMTVNQLKLDMEALFITTDEWMKKLLPGKWSESLETAMVTLKDMIDLIMKEPIAPTIDAMTGRLTKFGDTMGEVAREGGVAIGELAVAWRRALAEMFDPAEEDIDNWHSKFVNVLTDIRSQWASTFENMLNTGTNWKDFMEDMFLGVLKSFNHMIAQIAANDLLYAMTGRKVDKGGKVPTLWDIVPAGLKGLFGGQQPDVPIPGGGGNSYGEMLPQGLSKVAINIKNESGRPMNLRETGRQLSVKGLIINTVLEEMNTNPNVRDAIRG